MLNKDILYSVFNTSPVACLLLQKRSDKFFIAAINREYVKVTGFAASDLLNRELRECFARPDDPNSLVELDNLYDALNKTVETKKDSVMPNLRYDLINEYTQSPITKYWERRNLAILNYKNEVEYILHTVKDITQDVLDDNRKNLPDSSDKFKELLVNSERLSRFGTWELDLRTNQLHWSEGVFLLCGFEPNEFEVTFENGLAIIHPDDQPVAIQMMNDAIQKGAEYDIEKRFIKKDGTIINVQSKGKVIKNKLGESIKLIGVFQDITEQKNNILQVEKLVKEANESKENFQLLIDGISDGFVSFSSEWVFEYVNLKAAKLLGAESPNELIGKSLVELYPGILENSFFDNFKTAMYQRIPVKSTDLYVPTNTYLENRIYPLNNGGVSVLFSEKS